MLSRRRAHALLVVSAVSFALMALATKEVTARLGAAQVVACRFTFGLLAVVIYFAITRRPVKLVNRRLLAVRGTLGGIAVLLYFLAIRHLPVGNATLLNYSSPVFTATFSLLFLGEALRRGTLVAMTLAMIGVTLVVTGQGLVLGSFRWQLVGLVSAVLSGAAVTAIRAARRTDGTWEIFGAFSVIALVCTGPLAAATWIAPTGHEWLLLLAVGVTSLVAQIAMTHAFVAVDATTGGIMNQLTVVLTLLLGWWLHEDPLPALTVVGSLLTMTGAALATRVSIDSTQKKVKKRLPAGLTGNACL